MGGQNKGKHHQRTIDRIHLLVRLELANPLLNPGEIAQLAGIKPTRFTTFKALPLYRQIHNQYLTGVITLLDDQVHEVYKLKQTQETLQFAVPLAMQALLKQAMQEKDLRVQNKAANDILDRHGHFAKVRRIGIATPEQGGAGDAKDNDVAQELIKAMQTVANIPNHQQTQTQQTPTIDNPPITDTKQ